VVCTCFAFRALSLIDATALWTDELYSVGKSFQASPATLLTMLRHDTHYKDESFHWYNWTAEEEPQASGWVSQLHEQTNNMRAKGNPGPMVSIMSENNCPGADVGWKPDGHFDNGCGVVKVGIAGQCNCIYDPVGMVDVPATQVPGLADMKYAGRILIDLEYDDELNGLYPDLVEMDHWVTYFFHIFMRTDNKDDALHGKVPIRLASAYAGFAVYFDWKLGNPANFTNDAVDVGGALDVDVWNRGIPEGDDLIERPNGAPWTWGKYCNNAQNGFAGVDVCNDVMNEGRSAFPLSTDLEWDEWKNPFDEGPDGSNKKSTTESTTTKARRRLDKSSPTRHLSTGHFLPAFKP
jgi:hypothetical protein